MILSIVWIIPSITFIIMIMTIIIVCAGCQSPGGTGDEYSETIYIDRKHLQFPHKLKMINKISGGGKNDDDDIGIIIPGFGFERSDQESESISQSNQANVTNESTTFSSSNPFECFNECV